MHIFNMSVTYLQNGEKFQWKLKKELISQSMYYQSWYNDFIVRKMTKLKTLSVCPKNILSISNFFVHIFNMSVTNLQSIEKI